MSGTQRKPIPLPAHGRISLMEGSVDGTAASLAQHAASHPGLTGEGSGKRRVTTRTRYCGDCGARLTEMSPRFYDYPVRCRSCYDALEALKS